MPTFRTKPSSSLTEAVRRMVASGRTGLSPLDEMKADQAAADTAHKMSLVEKVRAEVEQEKAAQQQRANPAMRTEFAAHSAGINLPEATQLARHIRGEVDPNPQGQSDLADNVYGDVPVSKPANLPAGGERLFRNALAAAQANLLGTGKTNAAQLTEASGNVQTQELVQRVQDAVASGNFNLASAMSQGAKPGTAIKLHENIGTTGATFAPATGTVNADPAAQPANALLRATLESDAAKALKDRAAAQESKGGGKPPAGYRWKPDGSLEAVPGGPADLKLQGQFNQDTATLNNSTNSMDRLAMAANEALQSPGLGGITGLRGAIPNIPGTAAADAQAKLNTLKSQVAFGVLQEMRNNSKTGGALGQVSDAEGKRLEANLAALENAQSVEQMKDSLAKIIDYAGGAKDRIRLAYNLKHSGKGQEAPSGDALGKPKPEGAKVIGGKTYVKINGQWFAQ